MSASVVVLGKYKRIINELAMMGAIGAKGAVAMDSLKCSGGMFFNKLVEIGVIHTDNGNVYLDENYYIKFMYFVVIRYVILIAICIVFLVMYLALTHK